MFWDYLCIVDGMCLSQVDSLVGKCVAPLEKIFKDMVVRHFPNCHYSRDPTLNAVKDEGVEEEEEEEEEDSSSEEEESSSESSGSDSETMDENSSATVFEEHSYFTAKPTS